MQIRTLMLLNIENLLNCSHVCSNKIKVSLFQIFALRVFDIDIKRKAKESYSEEDLLQAVSEIKNGTCTI